MNYTLRNPSHTTMSSQLSISASRHNIMDLTEHKILSSGSSFNTMCSGLFVEDVAYEYLRLRKPQENTTWTSKRCSNTSQELVNLNKPSLEHGRADYLRRHPIASKLSKSFEGSSRRREFLLDDGRSLNRCLTEYRKQRKTARIHVHLFVDNFDSDLED